MKSVEKLGNLFSFYKDGYSCARSQKPPGVQFKQHCTNHLSKTKAVVKNSASKPLLSFPLFILFRDMATPQHNLLFEGSILFLCQNAQRPRNFMTIGVFFPGWNGILWVLVMIITIYIPGDFSLNSLETWIKPWRPHLKKTTPTDETLLRFSIFIDNLEWQNNQMSREEAAEGDDCEYTHKHIRNVSTPYCLHAYKEPLLLRRGEKEPKATYEPGVKRSHSNIQWGLVGWLVVVAHRVPRGG